MNRVDINCMDIDEPLWLNAMSNWAHTVMKALDIDGWDLSLALCGDETIKTLNASYRNKDEPTDVLSFESGESWEDPELGTRTLPGDIIISLDSLAKNAEYFRVSMDEELRRLIVHGILHLNGMDHQSNDAEEPMLVCQEALLANLTGEHIIQ